MIASVEEALVGSPPHGAEIFRLERDVHHTHPGGFRSFSAPMISVRFGDWLHIQGHIYKITKVVWKNREMILGAEMINHNPHGPLVSRAGEPMFLERKERT